MNLLAHVTINDGVILLGAFLGGLFSGSLATWLTLAGWFRKNR